MVALATEQTLSERVLAGERISAADALELYRWPLAELGALADARRRAAVPDETVTYIVDRNINYTNVCNVYCKFCAFYRTEKDADHYVLSFEELDQKLDELTAVGGVQILMQGGHHPKLGLRVVSQSPAAYPRRSIRTSTSTDSARRSSSISGRSSGDRCGK